MTRVEVAKLVVEAAREVYRIGERKTDAFDALRDALAAYDDSTPDSEGGWRPIETAPKDGTDVLLHVDWQPLTVIGFYGTRTEDEATWRVAWDHAAVRDGYDEPTHWQPLPAPPSQEHKP